MDKIETENELNFKVTNKTSKQTLIDENCCTLLTISLTNSGDVFTTFLGAYNEDILKLLKRTQKQYYKNLVKKLKASKQDGGPAEVTEEEHSISQNSAEDNKTTKKTSNKKDTKTEKETSASNKKKTSTKQTKN